MKKRVLFVDDEASILAGLRRMLRRYRDEWETLFAESGKEALQLLEEQPVDVIVSDMQMPGMDGAQLLKEVEARHLATVRIVLSGHSERESLLRSVGLAHQFLSKPCDADTLYSTIRRAGSLQTRLASKELEALVSRVVSLPSLPNIYNELVEELRSADPSIQRVAQLISKDVGMSAKLLQLVNSSFFGLPRQVDSPAQAATLLGLNNIGPIVLSAGIFTEFETARLPEFSLEELTEHSLLTCNLARKIAGLMGGSASLLDFAMQAGLLHDVGMLVLAANLPDQYREVFSIAASSGVSIVEAERAVFGVTHADVGAHLLEIWGLPSQIVEAVAFHHEPGHSCVESFDVLMAVHAANYIVNCITDDSLWRVQEIDAEYLARLGVTDQLEGWRTAAESICSCEKKALRS
ncbi:MAG: response regulator [Pirellulales bacterium]|nr:response regulator [Pirellulales bacterium]